MVSRSRFTAMLSAGIVSAMATSTAFAATPDVFPAPQSDRSTWFAAGQKAVANSQSNFTHELIQSNRRAKNVILFIGDGMGISTVTAARILAAQQPGIIHPEVTTKGTSGEENYLSFEKLNYLAHSKTYSVDQQTPDSAPTMTAMVTGVKINGDELAVDQSILHGVTAADCNKDITLNKLKTILERAEDAGKSTGIVSTARITHATPAATYAHTSNRDWEADSNQPAAGCAIKDIASQLIDFNYGNGIEVAMGGGRTYFLPNTVKDPEYTTTSGKRKDGRNLTAEWLAKYSDGAYVTDTAGFNAVNESSVNHLLGLFEPSHMQYEVDRLAGGSKEPSLSDMTVKSINILKKNPKGFFLHVEAGRIDHAHHQGNAYRALTDAVALSDAVQSAIDTLTANNMLSDTLIIVSADHSHVFTIAGYPRRGNNILGKVYNVDGTLALDSDPTNKRPYTTLSYANGGGYAVGAPADADKHTANSGRIADMTAVDTTDKDFHQESLVNTGVGGETHAGEDVGIYAQGPMAHLFHGTQDNTYIFHVMNKALGFNN